MVYTIWLDKISIKDIPITGGKNASLGEMINNLTSRGINIPFGYAITTDAFNEFINYNNLDNFIKQKMAFLESNNNLENLRRIGLQIRTKISNGTFPKDIEDEIINMYEKLSKKYLDKSGQPQEYTDVAVRSSGTCEDLPTASFAGQQETFLNIRGNTQLLVSIKDCFASLYNDRAISYRSSMEYDGKVSLSVCIQKMVRSDLASSGVAFSIDTESGFKNVVVINASLGLGELVVSGSIKPDEYIVHKYNNNASCPIIDKKLGNKTHKMVYGDYSQKTLTIPTNNNELTNFCLSNDNIVKLAKWTTEIEDHYSFINKKWTPMDIEWAIDGLSNELFIVQARPETVASKRKINTVTEYSINNSNNNIILSGIAVGDKISSGCVKILTSLDTRLCNVEFKKGDILVADMTDPDWEPLMKISSGIITNKGGRACHASIVARELGIPAIVGTENATTQLKNNMTVTISCAEGETGKIYNGKIDYTEHKINLDTLPKINTKVMLNVASPEKCFHYSQYPNKGVGLAREEFIINNFIKAHPLALINHLKLEDNELKNNITSLITGYKSGEEYFIEKLSYGIGRIATAFYPNNVIVRFSDFKSNEYYNLLGGYLYEPNEENPMIGWRGASRYYSKKYEYAFGLECKAIKKVREIMGLNNVIVMIPFCRTIYEMRQVSNVMKKYGLVRGENGLKVYLMCEIPSNVILADDFCKYVDGFSIGSNDLTQLTLGLDRDSSLIAHIFDERNIAVKTLIEVAIKTCKKNNVKIGICGDAPSSFPDFTKFLVENNIDSISITPDALIKTIEAINKVENT